jgi:hypothetical protein
MHCAIIEELVKIGLLMCNFLQYIKYLPKLGRDFIITKFY